jgi:hypothetical protein
MRAPMLYRNEKAPKSSGTRLLRNTTAAAETTITRPTHNILLLLCCIIRYGYGILERNTLGIESSAL